MRIVRMVFRVDRIMERQTIMRVVRTDVVEVAVIYLERLDFTPLTGCLCLLRLGAMQFREGLVHLWEQTVGLLYREQLVYVCPASCLTAGTVRSGFTGSIIQKPERMALISERSVETGLMKACPPLAAAGRRRLCS